MGFMMAKTEFVLEIEAMTDGGFTVSIPGRSHDMTRIVLAATTIDEALDYIKRTLGKPAEPGK